MTPQTSSERISFKLGDHRWAMVLAHPGHELRVFSFVEQARPLVSVLTDGSGSHGVPRLSETARLLDGVGATPARAFGVFSDRDAYARLMERASSAFLTVAIALRDEFVQQGVTAVVTDAAEGYNPVHDVCRILAETVVLLSGARAPLLFEIDLVGDPRGNGGGLVLQLDDEAFARKLDAVSRYVSIAGEAAAAFERYGVDAFRTEFLRRTVRTCLPASDHVPYYEQMGDQRVRQGLYRSVLRYGEHVRPVLADLLAAGAASSHALTVDPVY